MASDGSTVTLETRNEQEDDTSSRAHSEDKCFPTLSSAAAELPGVRGLKTRGSCAACKALPTSPFGKLEAVYHQEEGVNRGQHRVQERRVPHSRAARTPVSWTRGGRGHSWASCRENSQTALLSSKINKI